MRLAASSLLFAFLLLAPLAAAQVPPAPTPTYTVSIQNAPAAFTDLKTNGTSTAAFQVVLAASGLVCSNAVTVPVTITATPASPPAYATFTVEPSVVNITLPQGAVGFPTGTGGGSADAVLKVVVGNISANASVAVTLTADAPAPAGPPTGCQGAGPVSGATSAPVTVFANFTAPPPPPVEEPPAEDKGFLPGPGAVMGIVAATVAAVALRRKKL